MPRTITVKGIGQAVASSYDWSELNVYSNTRYALEEDCVVMAGAGMDIVPEDISVSDTATFVWEIRFVEEYFEGMFRFEKVMK